MPQSKDIVPPEVFADMTYPLAGISLLWAFDDQRPVPMPDGLYKHTCRSGVNVRGCEALTQRLRGGTRPGLARYVPEPVVADWIVQNLSVVTYTTAAAKA